MSRFTIDDLCALMRTPFSARQLDAITAPLEPAVIMAGAGSGKTSVMTARIVWLVATGAVEAHEVLGLTFTNKAAGEFRSRVRDALTRLGLSATDTALGTSIMMPTGTRVAKGTPSRPSSACTAATRLPPCGCCARRTPGRDRGGRAGSPASCPS